VPVNRGEQQRKMVIIPSRPANHGPHGPTGVRSGGSGQGPLKRPRMADPRAAQLDWVARGPENKITSVMSNNSVTLASININGIKDKSKRKELQTYFNRYDIICMQETHTQVTEVNRWRLWPRR